MNERVEQFRKMAEDDPSNELAHASLGREYLNAGMAAEAATSFHRALALNPRNSKAYQLLAEALLVLNKRDEAIESLTRGVKVAHERGDMMPKNAMLAKLKELGAPAPELHQSGGVQVAVGEGQVLCARCGRVNPKLARPPFKREFGQEIYEKICAMCWKEAIAMGTKVINELRLPLADPQAQKVWDQHIREFLGL
ncbi:MAG TPA: Fe(2+)-trafficking protein [Tepidisphaeraceae bacterium]|jgi:Fe-S cluster biosynthesis and repair protein YggX